ncbi:hypothetical protein BKA70DRAFT_1418592 [Coprinopsis sp. MPI-PUGE-AT-0042]|nr:hypothetical protein BKA70DRAFT_1418592 [Coprinopsis sp. MPI-PUGE-AT-0042]
MANQNPNVSAFSDADCVRLAGGTLNAAGRDVNHTTTSHYPGVHNYFPGAQNVNNAPNYGTIHFGPIISAQIPSTSSPPLLAAHTHTSHGSSSQQFKSQPKPVPPTAHYSVPDPYKAAKQCATQEPSIAPVEVKKDIPAPRHNSASPPVGFIRMFLAAFGLAHA